MSLCKETRTLFLAWRDKARTRQWFPVGDLINPMARPPSHLEATVVKVNPVPVPSKQRVLLEFRGRWPDGYEPMSGEDFQPLVG